MLFRLKIPSGIKVLSGIVFVFGDCFHFLTTSYGLAWSLFLAGLAGGVSHCLIMCGPFVVAQAGGIQPGRGHFLRSLILPYHLGRLTTYVLLAVVFNAFLNLAFLFQPSRALLVAPMLVTAAAIFIITAFPKLGEIFPWVVRLRLPIPSRFLSRFYRPLLSEKRPTRRFVLGVLLGFMPCGLVVSALMAAATAQDVWSAALAMAAFSFGTMPALFALGFGGGFLNRAVLPGGYAVRQGFMVLSALWLFFLAGALVL